MLGQMKLNARVSAETVDLVKRFEPFCTSATRLDDGRLIIGYRHFKFTRNGTSISETDGEMLLRFDLSEIANSLDGMILVPTTSAQFEALTAFAFDVGLENFATSSVLKQINQTSYEQAAEAIYLWRVPAVGGRGQGIVDQVRRRDAERVHFLGAGLATVVPSIPSPTIGLMDSQGLVKGGEAALVTDGPVIGIDRQWVPEPGVRSRWVPPARVTAPMASVSSSGNRLAPDTQQSASTGAPDPDCHFQGSVDFEPGPTLFDSATELAGYGHTFKAEPAHDIRREPKAILGSNLAYIVLGLLGVMLFVGAIVSMMRHANVSNLVAGLVGVLFMAPSAGHILFAGFGFIGKRIDIPASEDAQQV